MSKNNYTYLKTLNVFELINIFNKETTQKGWVGERGRFLVALKKAMEHKGISFENIAEKEKYGLESFSLRYPVFLREIDDKKILVPIVLRNEEFI